MLRLIIDPTLFSNRCPSMLPIYLNILFHFRSKLGSIVVARNVAEFSRRE